MTARCLTFTLLSVGCAAAVPAAHGLLGGAPAAKHSGLHARSVAGSHGADEIEACVESALDRLGLEPEVRAKVKEILRPHFDDAVALHEKMASGEIDHDTALAEHEQIQNAARADLAAVLTPDQIDRLFESLHPQAAMHR
jgi:hypothetical protein